MQTRKPAVADFLESIRLAELMQIENVLGKIVSPRARILEIGAGTGWQARELTSRGYQVSAIDIPTSNHSGGRIWPIIDFDGRYIPFQDQSFDVVFSSNVLEHVEDIWTLNEEIARVLRRGGAAIHYVPTSAWRAWSLAAFYPALARDAFNRARVFSSNVGHTATRPPEPRTGGRSLFEKIAHRVIPRAHGAEGTCWSELSRFSRHSWDELFGAAGWTVASYSQNGLFLTGDMLMGDRLPIETRARLSRFLGCTAHLYLLRRAADQ